MLQTSQIEKPRCSATTDQMRLRSATCLPVDSQNFLFSGSHSEMQVWSRLLIACSFAVAIGARLSRGQPFPSSLERHTDAAHFIHVKSAPLSEVILGMVSP